MATEGSQTSGERNVLPTNLVPQEYWLHITPSFEDFSFAGSVKILVDVKEETSAIKLNAVELVLNKISVEVASSHAVQEVDAASVVYDEKNMTATIPLSTPLTEQAYIHIEYTGTINDKLAGFYRSKYNSNGREIVLVTTQFEAVDARRALPCWDEPACKAVFNVTLTAPTHMASISNMHVVNSEASADGKLTTWTYAPSPKMSTYLLAWTIGELDRISETIKLPFTPDQETVVSVYTPLGKSAQASFALQVALKVVPLYEKFFDHGYNLKKLDLIAIPDFAAGAMENWGMITYREVAVLCDETSSASHRQYVAIVVAHELAHQWFGNLVTMEWWKELWLNEAFATYMEYWAVDKLYPEWNVFTQFVQSDGNSALQLDAMRSSHPVEVDVCNAQEIDEIFDAISYCKGGSVVRMAIEYIGEEAFQKGISAYINHFKLSNANTRDLWVFLGKAAGKDLAPVMESWTAKQGYPYLTVTCDEDEEGSQSTLTITQNRFLTTGDATEEENATVWKIPLLVRTSEESEAQLLVDERTVSKQIKSASWVKVNSRQAAFCRVKYDELLLQALVPALQSKTLSSLDRLSLVSDYHAFCRGGYASTVETLQFVKQFSESEDDYSVWSAIVDLETSVRIIVATRGDTAVDKYNSYCQSLYASAMKRVGYTPAANEQQNITQLRAALFARLVSTRHEETLQAARKMYAERATTPILADLHHAVYATHIRENGLDAVNEVKGLIAETTDAMERSRYLRALSAGCPAAISVSELFEYGFSDKVRAQDCLYLLGGLAQNSKVKNDFAREIMARWSTLLARLPGMLVGRCVKMVESGADAQIAEELKKFWETVSETDKLTVGRSFQQGVESLINNSKWAARDAEDVVESL